MSETIHAWHLLRHNRRLQYEPRTLVEPGQTLHVDPPLELCAVGLHASERPIDALNYAPSDPAGLWICRVELSGVILRGTDKCCASDRTCLWMADATRTLHEFAVWCARGALEQEHAAGREPDQRSWAALDAKLAWLDSRITDEELVAARDAARAVARDSARAAARDSAVVAAWDAAWDAAGDAAVAAAWAAAAVAARAAATDVQNEELTRRLLALAPAR